MEKAQPVEIKTNRVRLSYGAFRRAVRRFLSRFIPARTPQDYDKVDLVTGLHIRVKSSPFYVTFSVNERDFYWSRWSGKFDGTGSCFVYEHPGKPACEHMVVNLPFETTGEPR
jgi:hypothetical protein